MAPYTLYYFPFSSFSSMVRYAIALQGEPSNEPMEIQQKNVNLHKAEHLQEWYLTEINQKGQVPVLASPELVKPITESLKITLHVAQFYPSLLPPQHEATILKLLDELHAIQPLSLSIPPHEINEGSGDIPNPMIEELLLNDDISPKYRKSLEYKRDFYNSTLRYGLKASAVEEAKSQATQFFAHVHEHLADSSGWIFGGSSATALDAHCIVFVARLIEAENGDLVPPRLQEYARWAMSGSEWQSVMEGRPTLWTVYLRDTLIPAAAAKKREAEERREKAEFG